MGNVRREMTDKTIRALTVLETEVVSAAVKIPPPKPDPLQSPLDPNPGIPC
jgi:hypothetical protein